MASAPFENVIIKLWQTVADNGVGTLLRPWQIRRDGAAHAEVRALEIRLLAQAESDAEDVKCGRKRVLQDGRLIQLTSETNFDGPMEPGGRKEPSFNIQTIAAESMSRDAARSVQAEVNVSRSILYAEEALTASVQVPSDENVDSDWIQTWREFASKASKEDAHRLWGQVLAGEVKSPGTFSIRTLDFLRGLSKEDAIDITRLGSLFVEGRVFVLPNEGLKRYGGTVEFLLEMQQLGLLSGVGVQAPTNVFDGSVNGKTVMILRAHGMALGVSHKNANTSLHMKAYLFTKLGREVMQLGHFRVDEAMLIELGGEISKLGFDVRVGEWLQTHGNNGKLSNAKIVTR